MTTVTYKNQDFGTTTVTLREQVVEERTIDPRFDCPRIRRHIQSVQEQIRQLEAKGYKILKVGR